MDLAHRASNGDRAAVSRPAQVFPLYISTTIQTILSRRLPVMTYPHFTMFLSCYQFLLQLFLKSLGSLFASAQQVLQLVTFSTEISTAPPLQCEPESDALVDAEKPVYVGWTRHLPPAFFIDILCSRKIVTATSTERPTHSLANPHHILFNHPSSTKRSSRLLITRCWQWALVETNRKRPFRGSPSKLT